MKTFASVRRNSESTTLSFRGRRADLWFTQNRRAPSIVAGTNSLLCVTDWTIWHTKESIMIAKTAPAKANKPVSKRGAAKIVATVMEEARRAGLLDGDRTEHVSFRAPKALIDAAKRESGATKPTELGLLALAMLAQPDPTAKFLKETRGKLGADHRLDY
jgi:hypothetical protein